MLSLNELPVRRQYPVFRYRDYSVKRSEDEIRIDFLFSIDGLGEFCPTITIDPSNLAIINDPCSETARRVVFYMGLVEAVSYLKPVCPEKVIVECGALSPDEKKWWKHLWFSGLGEFFFINGITADEDSFLTIEAPENTVLPEEELFFRNKNLIPVGGGKDSCVTAELLSAFHNDNLFLTVNDQKARTDCVRAAGYDESRIVRTHRTIDPFLLELNRRGFLNGHTPFSAVVAFLSFYCALLIGANSVVLSNESSANEGNTDSGVNHQYSKSFEFERDFSEYTAAHLTGEIRYFSLLRPFSELQITKMFSRFPKYFFVFRSCNRGSKKNEWCGSCAKCLFVYGMLSAFLSEEELCSIFGSDLFEKSELLEIFKGLTGLLPVKPFECVGTAREYNYALAAAVQKRKREGKPLPPLLSAFDEAFDSAKLASDRTLLLSLNTEDLIPEKFRPCVQEMYRIVKAD